MGTEKKTGASLARHKSIQERGTPRDFIEAVEFRFGKITVDLAANKKNAVVPLWFGPGSQVEKDSLLADWSMLTGTLWLNPPFGTIAPWAAKLARECKSRSGFTPLLVPAAVGSNWFQQHVVPNSVVLELTSYCACSATDLSGAALGIGTHRKPRLGSAFQSQSPSRNRSASRKVCSRKHLKPGSSPQETGFGCPSNPWTRS